MNFHFHPTRIHSCSRAHIKRHKMCVAGEPTGKMKANGARISSPGAFPLLAFFINNVSWRNKEKSSPSETRIKHCKLWNCTIAEEDSPSGNALFGALSDVFYGRSRGIKKRKLSASSQTITISRYDEQQRGATLPRHARRPTRCCWTETSLNLKYR